MWLWVQTWSPTRTIYNLTCQVGQPRNLRFDPQPHIFGIQDWVWACGHIYTFSSQRASPLAPMSDPRMKCRAVSDGAIGAPATPRECRRCGGSSRRVAGSESSVRSGRRQWGRMWSVRCWEAVWCSLLRTVFRWSWRVLVCLDGPYCFIVQDVRCWSVLKPTCFRCQPFSGEWGHGWSFHEATVPSKAWFSQCHVAGCPSQAGTVMVSQLLVSTGTNVSYFWNLLKSVWRMIDTFRNQAKS